MRKIVCHGDSLTGAADLDRNYVWTALVANRIHVNIINNGIGGDTSAGLLGRFYPDVIEKKPDMVIIMAGTNDLWWDLDINIIQANIFAMACQAQYHRITPIVGLPLPIMTALAREQDFMEPLGGYERCEKRLSDLVAALALAAKKSDIACLDFYHLFLNKKGSVSDKLFLEDGLHPNQAGNRVMADQAVALFQQVFYFA
jgi:lysophospholipase L1-like esterase